jgi:hypothetical protein
MQQPMEPSDAKKAVLKWLSKKAADELRVLLETKHLYQKVDLNPKGFATELSLQIHPNHQSYFSAWMAHDIPKRAFVLEPQLTPAENYAAQSIRLKLPNLSLFCKICDRREAFAPVWHTDLVGEIRMEINSGKTKDIEFLDDIQMFSLMYQCQLCLGIPENFLVRREGWNLSLEGRSPMERIEVPGYLPKIESKLYRDAVIAFNSGKTLAALFYLRTFVEQFARRITGTTGKATGDEILDAYYEKLEPKHADQMPSLREWYDKLSEAVHSASEDATLFENAKSEIEKHFDFRRIFGIPETKPKAEPVPKTR